MNPFITCCSPCFRLLQAVFPDSNKHCCHQDNRTNVALFLIVKLLQLSNSNRGRTDWPIGSYLWSYLDNGVNNRVLMKLSCAIVNLCCTFIYSGLFWEV